jgi:hypothetical protein
MTGAPLATASAASKSAEKWASRMRCAAQAEAQPWQ